MCVAELSRLADCAGKKLECKKAGENKGRFFWMCARPVGEGYDRGQSKSDVNPEFRCKTFMCAVRSLIALTSQVGHERQAADRSVPAAWLGQQEAARRVVIAFSRCTSSFSCIQRRV